MPYEKSHADWIISEAKECFLCKQQFKGREYREVHSTTGFHLMLGEDKLGREVFVVTTIPKELSWMNIKYFGIVNEFLLENKYKADAVVVHRHCHNEVKLIALQLCRDHDARFRGNTPQPRLLHKASHHFLYFRRKYAEKLRLNESKYPR